MNRQFGVNGQVWVDGVDDPLENVDILIKDAEAEIDGDTVNGHIADITIPISDTASVCISLDIEATRGLIQSLQDIVDYYDEQ